MNRTLMSYQDAKLFAWWHDDEIAELFQVKLETVQGWRRENKAPRAVIISLMLLGGWIPSGYTKRTDWRGWRFSGGVLWSPDGSRFTAGDIRASRIDRDLVDRLMIETQG